MGWCIETFEDAGELGRFAESARVAFPESDLHCDVEWLAETHGWPKNELLVLADREDDKIVGLALFAIARDPLIYALGPVEILKLGVKQFRLYEKVMTTRPERASAVAACFETLIGCMPQGSVVCASAVPIGSELHRQFLEPTSAVRRNFHVLPWGGESPHCRIRWERSVDKYLASVSAGTRQHLRRDAKGLLNDKTLNCTVRRFQSPDDVEVFLSDGIAISDKTYQKRDLGLGLSLGGTTERDIRFAASRGGFLGHILYVDRAPVAFDYGFWCGRTCTMMQKGYDPAWAERQVGSVLFLESLRDYDRMAFDVDWLDYLPGTNLFKLRVTNDKRPIRRFYLLPRTLVGAAQFLSLVATDWLSRTVGSLIKRSENGEVAQFLPGARNKRTRGSARK